MSKQNKKIQSPEEQKLKVLQIELDFYKDLADQQNALIRRLVELSMARNNQESR